MTQAELSRHVRALVTSLQKSGLTVARVKVTFVQGVPSIDVTVGPESPLPAPVQTGEANVEEVKQRMRRAHERRA